jgi:4-azaleucine resistance transporter AzlC
MSRSPATAQDPSPLPWSLLAFTAPVAMGYVPLGTVFGFLFVQAGGEGWLAVLASIFVYAGAAQYMMIPMLAAGLPLGAIALATFIVNLRHVFYGLSLLDKMPLKPWIRGVMVFGLTDETYSVLTTMPHGASQGQLLSVSLLNQFWWVLGTTMGAWMGAQAKVTWVGLDFALASLFAVLTVEQWRVKSSPAPLWIALITYAASYAVAPQHALLVSIALSVMASAWLQRKSSAMPQENTHA